MRRIIFNQKGGVGKSSITVNLAALSAASGKKTLLIDLDIQGNSSHYLGIDINGKNDRSVADLFDQTVSWFSVSTPIKQFPQPTAYENLDIIPSSPRLAALEPELERRYKIYKLREALDELESEYERIYIDTPPNLNFYSKAGLIAAHNLLIPFDCDTFSHQALLTLMDNLAELRNDHNRKLALEGVVVNMFNGQAKFPALIIENVRELGLPLLEPFIPQSVKMKESHYHQKPLVHFAPQHKLSKSFAELYAKLEAPIEETTTEETAI
ncbi:cobalamin biosynthesis protein CobQ [Enterovibrio norvegicus FF-33]|uniref:ParA family protein n=1 Tax=Enterovibrio norvegicus TaxID=188144 RepID=UPI00031FDAD1|nr:ParA family protein [Enterovibrio norvegicus]OEE67503.1 cobalamin biosynthesis protein CobQ [Enterovibrio norvegicus FF-33]OEE81754.1 cobalamin biosynthesis protein CobQ [Enterovibrio norvegicus FF-162]